MIRIMIPDMPTADELLPYLREIDAARVYTNRGPLVDRLETAARLHTGAPCVAVANATLGLVAALRALRLHHGARVLIPAMTFRATGLAVFNAGFTPVLCDVDPHCWQMTPELAFECMPAGIHAVMPVATFGAPLDVDAWSDFAESARRPVIIDAAGALTAMRAPASPRIVTVYSLHATKHVGAGEGGLVSTTNAETLARVRELIAFGPGGTNAKMSEYHAAVALASLMSARLLRKGIAAETLHQQYGRMLPAVCRLQRTPMRSNVHMLSALMPIGAAAVIDGLHEAGIEARQWYRPFLDELDQFEPAPQPIGLDVTQSLRARLVGLPFHTGMSAKDVNEVCSSLAEVIGVPV